MENEKEKEKKHMKKTGPPGPRPKPRPRKKIDTNPQRTPPGEDPNLYTLITRDVGHGDERYRVFFRIELAALDRVAFEAVTTHLDGKTLEATRATLYVETRERLADTEKYVVKKIPNPVKKKRKASRK